MSATPSSPAKRRLTIRDAVHGPIVVPDRIGPILNTRHIFRLRNLKQLGATYYNQAFCSASHNRYEHSVGVMHLAHSLLLQLKQRQPLLRVTDSELFCMAAAGLLHDVGHGPFSHMFDHEFIPRALAKHSGSNTIPPSFRHEDKSVELITDCFERNAIPIEKHELQLIAALVSPSTHRDIYEDYRRRSKGFLFEIVANEENGVDVDKMDYLQRDAICTGKTISFQHQHLFQSARVIGDHICFDRESANELHSMFRSRYEMFKTVYTHPTTKAIEYQIVDILLAADEVLEISDRAMSPNVQRFLGLSDHILSAVRESKIDESKSGWRDLERAQKLLFKLDRNDLYEMCGECVVPSTSPKKDEFNDDEKADIQIEERVPSNRDIEKLLSQELWTDIEQVQNQSIINGDQRSPLLRTDLIIQATTLSLGNHIEHPMERCFFYDASDCTRYLKGRMADLTNMDGAHRERVVRCFLKRKEWKEECARAFKRLVIGKEPNHQKQATRRAPARSNAVPIERHDDEKALSRKSALLEQSSSSPLVD